MASIASNELKKILHTDVSIGRVNFTPFSRIVLENLYLQDQQGDSLFTANHVSAALDILPLFDGKLSFSSIRLLGLDVRLAKETPQSPLNLKFVIDAFASKDTVKKEKKLIDLCFNSVAIRRSKFSYHVKNAPQTPGKFNAKHVDIENISAKISLKAISKDSIDAQIERLSLDEASGVHLNKLALDIKANRDSALLSNLTIKLPNTDFTINNTSIHYSGIDSISGIVEYAPIQLNIAPSRITPKDISAFVPALRNFTESIDLSGHADGSINNIDLNQLTLRYGDMMFFQGAMNLKGIRHPEEAYIFGSVKNMFITSEGVNRIVNNFSDKKVVLPQEVEKLGIIRFDGEISGFFDNLVAFGKFRTDVGSIRTDINIGSDKEKGIGTFIKGKLSTSDIKLNQLLKENNPFGIVNLNVELNAVRPINGDIHGDVNANIKQFDFKGYRYNNISIVGAFAPKEFNGSLIIADPNGQLFASGLFSNMGKVPEFNFEAQLQNIRLDSLHLTNKYDTPDLSASLKANFTGNNIDNLEGDIEISDLSFKTAQDSFLVKNLDIIASGVSSDRHLNIKSDVLNAEISGAYSFKTIVPSIMNTFREYVPALINATQKNLSAEINNFSMQLTIENTERISSTLKLPVTIENQVRLLAHYNNSYNKFRVEGYLPKFRVGKNKFESGYLIAENPQKKATIEVRAINYNDNGLKNKVNVSLDAENDYLNTFISWANNKAETYKADISTTTHFVTVQEAEKRNAKKNLRTEIAINPTAVVIKDSVWSIAPSNVIIENKTIMIDNFEIGHNQEFALIDGIVSENPLDTLNLQLKDIELAYIFDVLNIPALQFSGVANGKFNISDLKESQMLNTDLNIENFGFNGVTLGRLNLFSEWDHTQQGIMMLGSIHKNDSVWTDVNGYIYPIKQGLSLYFDANDLNIAFLQPFLQNVAKDLQGYGTGLVHLYGPFSDLTVQGKAYIKDAGLGIEFLNTYYTFSDSVYLDPDSIYVKNLSLSDKFGNKATVNGHFNHTHFRDFNFGVQLQTPNLLMYNATEKQNPLMYGTVFGSGSATIAGDEKIINMNVNVRSNPNSSIGMNFMSGTSVADYDFITFVDENPVIDSTLQVNDTITLGERFKLNMSKLAQNTAAELRMNFRLDVTPDLAIDMIVDPISGDKIRGTGSGSLLVEFGTKSDLKMFGNYTIQQGNYNFSLQQVIHRDFKIREGSTISFRGDPLDASLNVDALYTLTAYLGDLDERLAQESARLNVPVNCILKIQNKLSDPKLSFDLELPSSSPELERQVQSLITTEDMMSRQIMYLLILSKFYTPDVNTQTGKTSSNFASVASSTISSQLSSILNSITDKVQIGTNIKANDATFDDTEVELMLSSQLLNNRLIFNGNFGYKNNPNIQSFVGDFDLEYKLTKSGEVRLKAYNHYNDMYKYLNSSQTTQGLGIMLKKDFNRPKEIFLTRKKLLLMKKLEQERRKKQAEEEQKQKEQAQETTWIYMKKKDE